MTIVEQGAARFRGELHHWVDNPVTMRREAVAVGTNVVRYSISAAALCQVGSKELFGSIGEAPWGTFKKQ